MCAPAAAPAASSTADGPPAKKQKGPELKTVLKVTLAVREYLQKGENAKGREDPKAYIQLLVVPPSPLPDGAEPYRYCVKWAGQGSTDYTCRGERRESKKTGGNAKDLICINDLELSKKYAFKVPPSVLISPP